MEATGEDMGLLHTIRPPKLEDAGLEDCALPLHSIHEAFLKAASAVASRATEATHGGCISDPSSPPPSDAVLGITPEMGPPCGPPCTVVKGGALVGDGWPASEDLVVGEGNEGDGEKKDDDVVVIGGGEGGGCVDGVRDLKIKESENGGDDEEEEEEEDDKKPTLIEGYFLNP